MYTKNDNNLIKKMRNKLSKEFETTNSLKNNFRNNIEKYRLHVKDNPDNDYYDLRNCNDEELFSIIENLEAEAGAKEFETSVNKLASLHGKNKDNISNEEFAQFALFVLSNDIRERQVAILSERDNDYTLLVTKYIEERGGLVYNFDFEPSVSKSYDEILIIPNVFHKIKSVNYDLWSLFSAAKTFVWDESVCIEKPITQKDLSNMVMTKQQEKVLR